MFNKPAAVPFSDKWYNLYAGLLPYLLIGWITAIVLHRCTYLVGGPLWNKRLSVTRPLSFATVKSHRYSILRPYWHWYSLSVGWGGVIQGQFGRLSNPTGANYAQVSTVWHMPITVAVLQLGDPGLNPCVGKHAPYFKVQFVRRLLNWIHHIDGRPDLSTQSVSIWQNQKSPRLHTGPLRPHQH